MRVLKGGKIWWFTQIYLLKLRRNRICQTVVVKIYAAFLSDMAVVGIEEPIIAAVAVAACYVWLVFSDVADHHMQSLEMTNLVVIWKLIDFGLNLSLCFYWLPSAYSLLLGHSFRMLAVFFLPRIIIVHGSDLAGASRSTAKHIDFGDQKMWK